MQKITPFLWYTSEAEEAMKFYVSVFKNAKAGRVVHYGKAGPGPEGTVMLASFELEGQEFVALNGGPNFKFTRAISFVVNCDTQEEIDDLWEKLAAGGKTEFCGWLQDKYGLSWQVVPRILPELLHSTDAATSQKVMEAMLKMTKMDIKTLKQAAGRA